MHRVSELKQNPLFLNVPEDALREAARVVTRRQFGVGDVVLEQQTAGEALHLLVSGAVRVSRVGPGSHGRVMGDVYAPGVIGETAVLGGGERSATVVALTDVTTLMLYRSHFKQLLVRHPQVLWNLSAMLVARVTALNDELIAFGLNTEAALSHVFSGQYRQRVAAGVPDPATLPLSITDIMLRVSASRETVVRVLRKLERQHFLTMTAHSITLLDPQGIEEVILDELNALD